MPHLGGCKQAITLKLPLLGDDVIAMFRQPSPKLDGIILWTVSIAQIPTQNILRRIQRIQAITIAWMSVEAALSLWAAWTARSPVLAAFGGDSAVELMSAAIVLWRFRTHASQHAEQRAARITGGLLFVLIAYVVFASAMSLLGYIEPRTSHLGMGYWWEQRSSCPCSPGRNGVYQP